MQVNVQLMCTCKDGTSHSFCHCNTKNTRCSWFSVSTHWTDVRTTDELQGEIFLKREREKTIGTKIILVPSYVG